MGPMGPVGPMGPMLAHAIMFANAASTSCDPSSTARVELESEALAARSTIHSTSRPNPEALPEPPL